MSNQEGLIAIIGVDGSGKTSVLEAVRSNLLNAGYGVQSLEIRTKKSKTGKISNHAIPVRSNTISTIKLLWRGLLWVWKFIFYYKPLLRQGQIMLCDRFYFDEMLLDPVKYRYGGTPWLARKVRNFLPSPNMYILLDAPATVLYERKQETTLKEVEILQQTFRAWAESQANSYYVNAADPLEKVIDCTQHIILKYLKDKNYPVM